MNLPIGPVISRLIILLFFPLWAVAQEEGVTVANVSSHYIDLKVKKLNKYNARIARQQDHLLNRLHKKEERFARKLKHSDSLAYARYQKQSLTFDSIRSISKSDTGSTLIRFSKRKNAMVDSLRGIQSFADSKSGSTVHSPGVGDKSGDLTNLQGKLNYRSYVNQLITKRTTDLKNISDKAPGLTGIQKQVLYGKARMNVFKKMEEDPTKAEEEAMEYLQGVEGFEKSLKGATQGGNENMQSLVESGATVDQLEKLGFQTKRQVQGNLKDKFGKDLGNVTKQMMDQVSEYREKFKEVNTVKETKKSLSGIKTTNKPEFKINPMRGLPFRKRLVKEYNFQTKRSGADAIPATVEPSFMIGFKHSPRLTYGIGSACSIGLGESWQNIRFSFEGIGARSFLKWQWQYGICAYAGYERMYKEFAFTHKEQRAADIASAHNTKNYNESVFIGLTKSFHVNHKCNGAIEVLYDIWWQQKGLQSPIILRFATITK